MESLHKIINKFLAKFWPFIFVNKPKKWEIKIVHYLPKKEKKYIYIGPLFDLSLEIRTKVN